METITFGDIVHRERNKKDLSLAKLANMLEEKIDPSYINRLEKNEKVNPSFKIVSALTKELDLDLREVFKSFGFGALISRFDSDGEVTIEQLIRLHKIIHPMENTNAEEMAGTLDGEKKEMLIQILHGIFEFVLTDSLLNKKLPQIIEDIHQLRELFQQELKEKETIVIHYLGVTFTFKLSPLCLEERKSLEDWKNEIVKMVDIRGSKLLDIPGGNISIPIGDQHWLAYKEGHTITLLSKETNIISL